ncbi:hypothetical protein ACFL3M_00450 [Patescibacteria group bacterium]
MKKKIIAISRLGLIAFFVVAFMAGFISKSQWILGEAEGRGKPAICTEANWEHVDGECQQGGLFIRVWTKISKCNKGVSHPDVEFIECDYYAPEDPTPNDPTPISGSRGIWHWKGYSSEWGTVSVVGNDAKENEVISDYQAWDIGRVYGSYGSRTVSEADAIANWNGKLDDAGINSESLYGNVVSDSTKSVLLSEVAKSDFLNDIQTEIIDFNRSRVNSKERFDAIHLDIEPQALTAEWDNGTPESRRQLMISMKDFYAEVEALINDPQTGDSNLKFYVDLGHYFDKLPSIGGKVGWTSEAERDQWYSDVSGIVDSISIMAYGTNSLSSITSTTEYERSVFSEAEIGLNVKEIGTTWTDVNDFRNMLEQIETTLGNITSIHSYRYLK